MLIVLIVAFAPTPLFVITDSAVDHEHNTLF